MEFGSATLPPAFLGRPSPLTSLGTHQALLQPAGSPTPPSPGCYTPGKCCRKSEEGRRPGGSEVIMRLILLKVKTSN